MLKYLILPSERSVPPSLFSTLFAFIKWKFLLIQNSERISILRFHNSGPNVILKTQWKTDCFTHVRM